MTKRDAIFFLLTQGQSANTYFSDTTSDLQALSAAEVDFEATAEPTLDWHRINQGPLGGHDERAVALGTEIVTTDGMTFPFVFEIEGISLTDLFSQAEEAGQAGWDGVRERLAARNY